MERGAKFSLAAAIILVGLLILGGLTRPTTGPATVPTAPPPSPTPGPGDITIVTNDTKAEWLGLVTTAFNAAGHKTGAGHPITVRMIQESSPGPTVDKIVKGELQPALWSPGDISWIEQANQQLKDLDQKPVVTEACPRIVYAATGFGMWQPMGEALGWPDKPIGWKTIVDLAGDSQGWAKYGHPEWGQFKFGHAHPEQSTTGFNMLATLAYAAAGKTSGLTPEDVQSAAVKDAFRKVEKDTYHYGTSTSGLLNLMAKRGPSYLHATTASETAVIKTNQLFSNTMRFPHVFIFPAEGAFWMDNPACLLDASWVTDERSEAAKIYRDYLLAPAQQDKAVQIGLRPAVTGTALHCPICLDAGTDPRVSPQTVPPLANVSGATNAAIIDTFKETKKKATVVLVLDTSGSMRGEKINSAAAATRNFLARLAPEDEVQLITFSGDRPRDVNQLGPASEVRTGLLQALERPDANSNTPLNDAICSAVASAAVAKVRNQETGAQRLYGVVALTDGQENASQQKSVSACLPTGEDVDGIKVFTIAYGSDADKDQLKKIAERTNGKFFAGDPATIDKVYLTISAEQ